MLIDSEYFDLAIALTVVFFLTSLVVSGINEGLQWLTRVRSKFLWSWLYELTSSGDASQTRTLPRGFGQVISFWFPGKKDPRPRVGGASNSLVEKIADSLAPIDAPQIYSWSSPTNDTGKRTSVKHIPPKVLAQALLEVFVEVDASVVRESVTELTAAVAGSSDEARNDAAAALARLLAEALDQDVAAVTSAMKAVADTVAADDDLGEHVTGLATSLGVTTGDQLAEAFGEYRMLIKAKSQAKATANLTAEIVLQFPKLTARANIDKHISSLAGTPFGPTLQTLWVSASKEIDAFRGNLESWLDAEMTRLSGFYKRSVRWIIGILALLVAVLLNVDALATGQELWDNPEGRAALVAQAQLLSDSDSEADASSLGEVLRQCQAAEVVEGETIDSADQAAERYDKVQACVRSAIDQVSEFDLLDEAIITSVDDWKASWTEGRWMRHGFGVGLTWAALVMGAPFWFDLMKRLTGARRHLIGDT